MTSSMVYTPFVATHSYTRAGYALSRVYTLLPQTEPFTPSDTTCSIIPRSIRCEEVKLEDITSGYTCYGMQFVGETTTSIPTQCFPETYNEIWKPFDVFSDIPSLAYPGTACLSGWTSACATTVQRAGGEQYFQTWCCPSGWDCLTISSGQNQIPHRECVSLLTTPTEIWINDIVTTRGSESIVSTSWRKVSLSNLPSGGPIVVNHPVFPLYGRVPVHDEEAAKPTGLSTGAIAGISIAIVVVVSVLLGSCS
ncbi:hypothetical protein CSHISOI_09910 [Colletotrichum shisoi]|uniref:Uncharacterized protein n=1 Tax=Colletotrichum shisoi TaxID=2078593 RepID=A0A5Q4BFF7_9PEZI|nr:hypothetical protein CSHISOI_09910 [Colletotrichum shisoi]